MPLNPLECPWGKHPPKKSEPKATEGHHIGKRNEAVRNSAAASSFVTIRAVGVPGAPSGDYRLEYSPGAKLGTYLARLGLKAVALRAAVVDEANPSHGRLRMSYIPQEGAIIVMRRAGVSSAIQYQRTNYDAAEVARRMDGGARVALSKWKK